jgi:flagellar hook-associated protein 1 FlgK
MASFFSLYIGYSGLKAQMAATEVAGQNIANANTPGYTRQHVSMEAVVPHIAPGARFSPGQGVRITGVERIKSDYYTEQLINASGGYAYWETRQSALEGIEVNFLEPSDSGLSSYLNEFWDSWQELSANPESEAVRMGLLERSVSLTRGVQNSYRRLQDLQYDLYSELETKVEQVNKIAEEIATINEQLVFLKAMGEKSNELLDQLDRRISELSHLADIRVRTKDSGAVEVFISGRLLVQDNRTFAISISGDADGNPQIVNEHGSVYNLKSGSLSALLEAHNKTIPYYQRALDVLVSGLVEEINAVHQAGADLEGNGGIEFFQDLTEKHPPSLYFEVNPQFFATTEGYKLIAATAPGAGGEAVPGDGANAGKIHALRDQAIIDGGFTPEEFYRSVIGRLGVEGQESERMFRTYDAVISQLELRQEAIFGVSLDEEMLNMVRFQHAYNAAAKFMSTADQMLDLLIKELG